MDDNKGNWSGRLGFACVISRDAGDEIITFELCGVADKTSNMILLLYYCNTQDFMLINISWNYFIEFNS